jgi:hypothetical protein
MNNFELEGYQEQVGTKLDIYTATWKKMIRNIDKLSQVKEVWFNYPKPPLNILTKNVEGKSIEETHNMLQKHINESTICRYLPDNYEDVCKQYFKPIFSSIPRSRYSSESFYIPDTGTMSIIMSTVHYPDHEIYITGCDGYMHGSEYYFNRQRGKIYEQPWFSAPVLQQYCYIKRMVATKKIKLI